MPLQFVTFTGADDRTKAKDVRGLARRCGVPSFFLEVGILLSKSRQGTPRYPTLGHAYNLLHQAYLAGMRCSVHLCGSWAREMASGSIPEEVAPILADVDRIQVNGPYGVEEARVFSSMETSRPWEFILQSRDPESFPEMFPKVSWLYDISGGHGVAPSRWPTPPQEGHVGYAGGLSEENVVEVLRGIGSTELFYWVDMESSLRGEEDLFDLEKCKRIARLAFETVDGMSGRTLMGTAS